MKPKLSDLMKSIDKDIESDNSNHRWFGINCIKELVVGWVKGDLMILYDNLGDYARAWLFAMLEHYRPELYTQIEHLDNRQGG